MRGMKVYLEKGYAFVPQMELVVIIVNAFRSRLSHDLVVCIIIKRDYIIMSLSFYSIDCLTYLQFFIMFRFYSIRC